MITTCRPESARGTLEDSKAASLGADGKVPGSQLPSPSEGSLWTDEGFKHVYQTLHVGVDGFVTLPNLYGMQFQFLMNPEIQEPELVRKEDINPEIGRLVKIAIPTSSPKLVSFSHRLALGQKLEKLADIRYDIEVLPQGAEWVRLHIQSYVKYHIDDVSPAGLQNFLDTIDLSLSKESLEFFKDLQIKFRSERACQSVSSTEHTKENASLTADEVQVRQLQLLERMTHVLERVEKKLDHPSTADRLKGRLGNVERELRERVKNEGRDPEQAYFWSEKWQEGEREVDEEVERGEIQSFDNFEDFEAWLDEP